MKKLIPLVFLVLNSLSPSLAQADPSDWTQLTTPQQKYRLFINTKLFQREGEVVNATLRYTYSDVQVFPFLNVKYDKMDRSFAFQCNERKMVVLENNYLLGENKVHSVSPSTGNPFQPKGAPLVPQKVESNSLEDEALTQACAFVPPKK